MKEEQCVFMTYESFNYKFTIIFYSNITENAISNGNGNQKEYTNDNHTFTNVHSIPKCGTLCHKNCSNSFPKSPISKVLTDCLIVTQVLKFTLSGFNSNVITLSCETSYFYLFNCYMYIIFKHSQLQEERFSCPTKNVKKSPWKIILATCYRHSKIVAFVHMLCFIFCSKSKTRF